MDLLKKFSWLKTIFADDESAKQAKERLRLVLIQDQANISPGLMNVLRNEMIGVVSRYMEIDSAHLEMGLERRNDAMALAASIPIVRIRKEGRLAGDGGTAEDALMRETAPAASREPSPAALRESSSSAASPDEGRGEKRYRRVKRRYR